MSLKKLIVYCILNISFVFLLFYSNIYANNNSFIVKSSVDNINISVDSRTELISAIQIISGQYDFMLTQYDFKYKEDMKNYFKNYKNHEAVKLFTELIKNGFDGSAIPTAVLYLSENYSLDSKIVIPDELIDRIGEKEKVYEFLNSVQDFAEESKFDEFYKSHKAYYKILVDENSKLIENKNYIKIIENYYNMKNSSYNIILVPVFWNGGFNGSLEKEKNKIDVISILGTRNLNNDISQFGNEEQFKDICMHEFSHSFVDKITQININSVNKYSNLLEPIIEKMKIFGGYAQWDISVNEHIIRAVVIRLANLDKNSDSYKELIMEQKKMGFSYIEPILEKLEYYEDNKKEFKTFENFYPEIIEVFEELSSKKLSDDFYMTPFDGTLNSVLFMGKPIVAISPTFQIDRKTQNEIYDNLTEIIEGLKDFYLFEAEIITDEKALNMDLTNKNIIVIGTLENNAWLKKYYNDINIPFKFTNNKLIADKEYTGDDLKLLIAAESPFKDNAIMMLLSSKTTIFPKLSWYNDDNYGIWDNNKKIKSGNYYNINY